ncbi:MAG: UDP-3-O-(3-hydroxymyristoyl)glucosamine N-acyltransferase [Synergistaceae bacterium]|nr:UDP-3-O-(3-hydroxymyristoyl)glucosamine N-acyltransferase [Synergistaceae bacterium]
MNISLIAETLGIETFGNEAHEVSRISSPDKADPQSLCVIWDKKALEDLPSEVPIVAPEEFFVPGRDGLISQNPRAILPELLALFSQARPKPAGIHPNAVISPDAKISPSAYIGACAYVGDGCVVGDGTVIEPNATLLANVRVGKNCLIHSGAVIGADGFGFERTPDGLVKIPQTGGVTLGDDVEIGACTTIDRGTMSDTIIGSGTKIDNHVQVGHNVQIGKNCIICSMTGIAGSSVIEDNVTISVQAGITDHVRIGAWSILAARTGVTNDIPPNSLMSGFPARPHNEAKRALVLSADLPSLYKRVRILERWCKNHEA